MMLKRRLADMFGCQAVALPSTQQIVTNRTKQIVTNREVLAPYSWSNCYEEQGRTAQPFPVSVFSLALLNKRKWNSCGGLHGGKRNST